MSERLFPHDAVRLERPAPLKGDHASAQLIVEDIPILGSNGIPIQIAQTLPDPFHVLAPRARLDRELAQRGALPEDDEWPVPVSIHRAQRQREASSAEIECDRAVVEADDGCIASLP